MRTPFPLRAAPALAGFLLLSLAGCNSQPQTITATDTDDQKEALARAKPVELPPSIAAAKSFRCKDNSVVYVDFYSDNKSAGIHLKKDGAPAKVTAAAPGQPMTGEGGYALTGSATASSADITLPGKDKQSCDSE